ncbi:MAG: SsrA-binding protein SmpB [Candidatus Omnitrophica bacterium]|nr:SsrA-binding protein SmpB [Candidatus Omnitrophota bacterium]
MENKRIASNKRAAHRYEILQRIEAGIVLLGTEVKSLRANKVDLTDSFARIQNEEVFLYNLHISPYDKGSYANVEPTRVRKLLLNKREITKLFGKIKQKGYSLIALSLYFNSKGKAKVELGLGRGRKLYDQREKIAKKETDQRLRKLGSFRK